MDSISESEGSKSQATSSRRFAAAEEETEIDTATSKEAETTSAVNAQAKIGNAKTANTASISPSSSPLQPQPTVMSPTTREFATDVRVRSDVRQPLSTPTPSVIRQIQSGNITASLDAVTRVATSKVAVEDLDTAPSDGPAPMPTPKPAPALADGSPTLYARGGKEETAPPRSQSFGSKSPTLARANSNSPPLTGSPSSLKRIMHTADMMGSPGSIVRQLSHVSSEEVVSNARRVGKLVGDKALSSAVHIKKNTARFYQRPATKSDNNGENFTDPNPPVPSRPDP
jgi:hypothetical protein